MNTKPMNTISPTNQNITNNYLLKNVSLSLCVCARTCTTIKLVTLLMKSEHIWVEKNPNLIAVIQKAIIYHLNCKVSTNVIL